jgi:hypothetical protein
MRHRKLAVVLGILVLAACSAEGPANNKRDATAAALSLQKSPRKYKAPKFDSNVRVLAQIPIQGVKKDDDCDWSAEFAKAVSGYEAKHPEKEEGRGASLTEWDKDSCAAVVSIVVAKTHENVTPKTVDTLSIQVVGGPVVSPEFELVRRKLRMKISYSIRMKGRTLVSLEPSRRLSSRQKKRAGITWVCSTTRET